MFRVRLFPALILLFCCMTAEVSSKPDASFEAHSSEKEVWGREKTVEKTRGDFPEKEVLSDRTLTVPPSWLEYAVPVPEVPEEAPMIAIVIDDLGLNKTLTREVLSLPAPITASFLSYAEDLPRQTAYAAQKGHELLLHTPMEPVNPQRNSGPDTLKTTESDEEIREKLEVMFSAFDGYVGINNHMGSKFTADEKAIAVVIKEIAKRGLLFLDSMTCAKSVAWKEAKKHQVPYVVRDVFLDNSQEEAAIRRQLLLLERNARKNHIAVAIGHPHHTTVRALKKWIPQARRRGFVFVPVSMVALVGQESF